MTVSSPAAGLLPAHETHQIALRSNNRLIAHSDRLGWRDLYGSLAAEAPWSAPLQPVEHPCLVYCLHQSATIRRRIDGEGRAETAVLGPGRFSIIPAQVGSRWEIGGHPHILLLYLRRAMVERIAQEDFNLDCGRVDFIPRLAAYDPLLEQLALAAIDCMRSDDPACGAPYADSLARMIAAHLLAHHSAYAGRSDTRPGGGIGHGRMQRVRDYIEASLDNELDLDTLAAQAGISVRYFARVFRRHFGDPPHRYVLKRRIERARRLLRSTDLPVVEIALTTGFSSQSHLTAAFKKSVGVGPARYRRDAGY
jgi:AraC family transcriptional regulator